jgi:type IV pilus assembly protein PilW
MIKRESNFVASSHRGFSLIELMVAMAIGLFLIAGVFSVYVNGRHSQNTVDEQVAMVDNARFALDTIAADIRQSGVFGRTKDRGKINPAAFPAGGIPGECTPGWITVDANITPIQVFDGTAAGGANPYPTTCTGDYLANTPESDAIEMRYSMMTSVKDAAVLSNIVYLQGDVDVAQLFYDQPAPPITELKNRNYMFVTNLYYIAANGDPGDGIPSLHRASLQPGGVVDQVLLSGVENMQIQLGIDTNGNRLVDKYVDSGAVGSVDWKTVKTIQIWLVIRSLNVDMSVNTVINPNIAGVSVQLPANGVNDGIRRMVVSTVALLRNGP